jgi:hypothetical protein
VVDLRLLRVRADYIDIVPYFRHSSNIEIKPSKGANVETIDALGTSAWAGSVNDAQDWYQLLLRFIGVSALFVGSAFSERYSSFLFYVGLAVLYITEVHFEVRL